MDGRRPCLCLGLSFPMNKKRKWGKDSWGLSSFVWGVDTFSGSHMTFVSGPRGSAWAGGSAQVTARPARLSAESSVAHGVVSRGGRLQLSRLQPAQAGTYTCVAENAQAEARKDFTVAVLGMCAPCTLRMPYPHAAPATAQASPQPLPQRPPGSGARAPRRSTASWRGRRCGWTAKPMGSRRPRWPG